MMKKILYAAMLLLGLSLLSSCNKIGEENKSEDKCPIIGTWEWAEKVSINENMSEAEQFVVDLGYITFNSDGTASFKDWDNKDKGTYKYSFSLGNVIETDSMGKAYESSITFSSAPLSGGKCEYVESNFGNSLTWKDKGGVSCCIRKYR